MKKRLTYSIFLLTLTTQAFAAYIPKESTPPTVPGKFYIGAFGGGGSSNDIDAIQYGTAFFTEAQGGPLAVNAFGELEGESGALWGGQVGYQAPLKSYSSFTLGAAIELEGYSMNERDFDGELFNDTDRLPEHDFAVSFPMERTVFLANAILSVNNSDFPVHPYIGVGFGEAILRISDAVAIQIDPLEVDINHYNANSSDTDTTFAGQVKVGLSFDFNECLSVFADYRWLYIADSEFTLGSTTYPTHAPTSSWEVLMDAHHYNLGSVGLRLSV